MIDQLEIYRDKKIEEKVEEADAMFDDIFDPGPRPKKPRRSKNESNEQYLIRLTEYD
jgi:hypothetical protein